MDFFLASHCEAPNKMKSIHNAVSDVVSALQGDIESKVIQDEEVPTRWRVQIRDRQIEGSLLEIEVLAFEDSEPVACVLRHEKISHRVLTRFMDLLMESL